MKIDLTINEALVLYDFLSRLGDDADYLENLGEAEKRVIWDASSKLEKNLDAPASADYDSLLDAARRDVLK